ncbi:hypothetical protein NPIL_696511, partial [Nephila pilipes]
EIDQWILGKQWVFFSPDESEADLKKKGDATGRSSVCSLFHIDKVGVTSATKFWTQYGRDPLS